MDGMEGVVYQKIKRLVIEGAGAASVAFSGALSM
jgi:hypothetical protein